MDNQPQPSLAPISLQMQEPQTHSLNPCCCMGVSWPKKKAPHLQLTGRLVISCGYISCHSGVQPTGLSTVQRCNLLSFAKQKCL